MRETGRRGYRLRGPPLERSGQGSRLRCSPERSLFCLSGWLVRLGWTDRMYFTIHQYYLKIQTVRTGVRLRGNSGVDACFRDVGRWRGADWGAFGEHP